jgi:hypothetical protein
MLGYYSFSIHLEFVIKKSSNFTHLEEHVCVKK